MRPRTPSGTRGRRSLGRSRLWSALQFRGSIPKRPRSLLISEQLQTSAASPSASTAFEVSLACDHDNPRNLRACASLSSCASRRNAVTLSLAGRGASSLSSPSLAWAPARAWWICPSRSPNRPFCRTTPGRDVGDHGEAGQGHDVQDGPRAGDGPRACREDDRDGEQLSAQADGRPAPGAPGGPSEPAWPAGSPPTSTGTVGAPGLPGLGGATRSPSGAVLRTAC